MKTLENGESEKMTNLNSYMKRQIFWGKLERYASNGQIMPGVKKELGFKIACPLGRPRKRWEDQVKDGVTNCRPGKNGRS